MSALASSLEEETFGEKLTRARARRGVQLWEAAARISRVMPTSPSTLSRLEDLSRPPVGRRRRAVAALYALSIGYDPAVFGLDRKDVPAVMDPEHLAEVLGMPSSSPSSACLMGDDALPDVA